MGQLRDYRAFLSQFVHNYQTTGALIPSGRALAGALCRHVGAGAPQCILEAGPGTGAVTRRIVERLRRQDQLWMVELNAVFAAHLRRAFTEDPALRTASERCHLVEASVQELGRDGQFDIIVSGLPLNNFSPETVRSVLAAYARLLKPGGLLSFFEYIWIRDAKMVVSRGADRERLREVGETIGKTLREREVARETVWSNVPPAWVHHLKF